MPYILHTRTDTNKLLYNSYIWGVSKNKNTMKFLIYPVFALLLILASNNTTYAQTHEGKVGEIKYSLNFPYYDTHEITLTFKYVYKDEFSLTQYSSCSLSGAVEINEFFKYLQYLISKEFGAVSFPVEGSDCALKSIGSDSDNIFLSGKVLASIKNWVKFTKEIKSIFVEKELVEFYSIDEKYSY